MQLGKLSSPLTKIFLLLILVLLLNLSPVSTVVEDGLRKARAAQEAVSAAPSTQQAGAADGLRQAVLREPWRTDLWEPIGRFDYYAGRSAQAREALQTALQYGSLSPEGYFLLGEVNLQEGDTASAETAWRAIVAQGCSSGCSEVESSWIARAYERLLDMRAGDDDFSKTVQLLEEWNASPAASARSAYLLGIYLSITEPGAAEAALIEAAREDQTYSQAVQVLRGGLALYGSTEQPAYGWLMIGRSLGSVDQWALAERAFQSAIEIAPDYAEAWAFLSEARAHTGGSGQPEMERALFLAPKSTLVNALNALALRRQSRYTEALEFLQAVAREEPDEPFWLIEIANTLVDQGDLMSARDYFERAAVENPDKPLYWQLLAMFSIDYNVDIRGLGLPAARKAVMLAPDDPASLDAMGWALANLDDGETGERFLQHALEAAPAYPQANLHLAQIYLQREQSGRAYAYLKQAAGQTASHDPASMAAVETARRLLRRHYGED